MNNNKDFSNYYVKEQKENNDNKFDLKTSETFCCCYYFYNFLHPYVALL